MAVATFTNITGTVSGATMTKTLTTTGGNVLIGFSCAVRHAGNQKGTDFGIFIDGTQVYQIRDVLKDSTDQHVIALTWLATSLTAASHTFAIQWKTDVGNVATSPALGAMPVRSMTLVEVSP